MKIKYPQFFITLRNIFSVLILFIFSAFLSQTLKADQIIYQGEDFQAPQEIITEVIEEMTHQWTGQRCIVDERLFPDGLPWVFKVFSLSDDEANGIGISKEDFKWIKMFHVEQKKEPQSLLVVIGNLEKYVSLWDLPYRGIRVNPGASMEISDPKGEFFLYDSKGIHFKNVGGRIIVPLNTEPYFIKTETEKAWKHLLKAIEKANIRNVSPLEFVVEDLKKPVGSPNNMVTVQVHNILNRKAEGKIQLLAPGLFFWGDIQEIKLKPYQTKKIEFKADMSISRVRDGNNYPVVVMFTEILDREELPVVKFADTIHVRIPEDSPLEPLPIHNPLVRPPGKLPPTPQDDPWRPVLLHLDWTPFPTPKKHEFKDLDIDLNPDTEIDPALGSELEKRLKKWSEEEKNLNK